MKVIAHRGASADAPENTLAAIRLAIEHGADGVEIDVHMTRDGVPVLLHDPTLHRTCGLRRRCADLAVAELAELDAGSWKSPRFRGERVPTLQQALATVPPHLSMLIEVKAGPAAVPALLDVLRASPRTRAQNILMSFDWDSCCAIRRQMPEADVFGLLPEPRKLPIPFEDAAMQARLHGFKGLGISDKWLVKLERNQELAARTFARHPVAGEAGLTLSVWTVDDPARATRWKHLGASYVTTNKPLALLKSRP